MIQLGKDLYTAKAHTAGGQDGASRTSDGRLDVKLSTPGTPGVGTNMPSRINQSRSWCVSTPVIIACLVAASAAAQTGREVRGTAAVVSLQNEPPAKIIIDSPLAERLSYGGAVIQYGTENLHMAPVFGP